MAAITYMDSLYSFRITSSLIKDYANNGPDAATLAQIENYLTSAANAYYQHNYNDSITDYKQAGLIIYGYLDPHAFPVSISQFNNLSRDPKLFDNLLSAGAQYLNILPIASPQTVRPPLAVDPAAIGSPIVDKLGIRSTNLNTAAQLNAAADVQASANLQQLGMTTLAGGLETTAARTDPKTAAIFKKALNLNVVKVDTANTALATPQTAIAQTDLNAAIVGKISLLPVNLPSTILEGRTLGIYTNAKLTNIAWKAGTTPDLNTIKAAVYNTRATANLLNGDILLNPTQPSDIAVSLPHYYYYTIPLGIAEALYALGDYANAETYYYQAASYPYLNQSSEVPYLFRRLASLYLDWGNSYFIQGDPGSALPIYENLIMPDGSVPASKLFSTANLKVAADTGRQIITDINNSSALTTLAATVNPTLIATFVECFGEIIKINNGLDYWGMAANSVPIWTFDYLQSVAVNFTQLAMSTEKDFITFQDNSDQGSLTQTQLIQNLNQSVAEIGAAQAQADAANAQVTVYQDGVNLANTRVANAQANAASYATDSWYQNLYQASASQIQGGDDGDPDYLNQLASQLMSGNTISGDQATVGAATQLAGSMYSSQYEIGAMNRTVTEMQAAAVQAQDDLVASQAAAQAAQAQVTVADVRATGAAAMVSQFNSQYFTPDVWAAMSQDVYNLYKRYFKMAIKVAKLMQQAYNFETDQTLTWIKNSYSSDEVKGLLGADALMADVQQFTYDLVTSTKSKTQPLRQTISLSSNYPFIFETQFRTTGIMDFETRVDDFDAVYPGIYAGRIESIEVAVNGIVPVTGLSGTLTNAGISVYRLPSASWPTDGSAPGVKYRVQPKESLVLSDYEVRNDSLLYTTDNTMLRIFQGSGVASSWHLEIPRGVNNIDYGSITDIQITFYYKARYDDTLKTRVLSYLASLPGVTQKDLSLPLRWLYPDAFYAFQSSGACNIALRTRDFRRNETNPLINNIGILVATNGVIPASGITMSITAPGKAAVKVVTDATGTAASTTLAALAPLLGGTAIGSYSATMTAADNPAFVNAGKFDLSPVINIVLLVEYNFTPRV